MNSINTSNRLRGLILTGILSALAVSFSPVSSAADSEPVRTSIVKYNDLNVSSPQGADALYRRIQHAAVNVCWVATDDHFYNKIIVSKCVHKAVADAVMKINNPALFDAYNAKNPMPLPIAFTADQTR
jgi:UrcA family protein